MKNYVALILLFIGTLTFSQTLHLSGKITNEENTPVDFAEVILSVKDSVLRSELTGEDGSFTFSGLLQENYTLDIKQAGEILHTQDFFLTDNLDLGNIRIQKAKELQNVVVTGQRKLFERKVDRLVFNVENSIAATGSDALDALKVTPGVQVQNDRISLIGKSGVSVLVDDRPVQLSEEDLINYLRSIPSNNIKSIEVITTPPAKYDAEGNSGIINIQLKKARPDSWNGTLDTGYRQGESGTGNVGGSYNYNKDKLTIALSGNYSNGKRKGTEKSEIRYPSQEWNNKDSEKYYTNMLSARGLIDYRITKKWNMGIQYVASYNKPVSSSRSRVTLSDYNSGAVDSTLITKAYNRSERNLNSVDWYSTIVLDTLGKKLDLKFDYFNYSSDTNNSFDTNTFDESQKLLEKSHISAVNSGDLNINNYSAQIDMEHPTKFINLSYGGKLTFTQTNSEVRYFDTTDGTSFIDPTKSNTFGYKENIQALYVSGNKNFGKNKWQMQLGLRLESTQTEGASHTTNQNTKHNYWEVFPTFYLRYSGDEKNSYSLSYSRRIQRPGYNSVNPFRYYSSSYSYSEGNPFLTPVFSHNVELSYVYKDHLQTVVYFSTEKDNYGQVAFLNNENYVQEVKRLNYFDTYSIGVGQTYSYNKLSWWQSYNTLVIYHLYSKSQIYPVTPKSVSAFSGVIYTNNTFIVNKNKTLSFGFVLSYIPPFKSSDLVKNRSKTQMDVFFRMLFLDKKLQISLQGNNLFKAYDFDNTSPRNGIEARYSGFYDTRYFRISLSYKLGNSNLKTKRIEESNKSEQNRIN
ncbi:MAG: TonB-dependent receptor [Flavobacteriaceae bacterium]|jgi:hypothetical protein|nr:TonB-dependent receptor [Flavobacteriaceae bacterium]